MQLTRRDVLQFALTALAASGSPVSPVAAQTGWRAASGDWLETLSPGRFPAYLKDANPKAREMYRFAVANGETLRYIPCYCGCGNPRIGHKSNADCYVAERFPDGRITFTSHAVG
jgi:hypothetical protein